METSGASTPSSSPPRDLHEVWGMPQKNFSYFNFIVAERKEYIPGSGPPLQPVTAALQHDKTGYIIDKVFFKKELRYLVGFRDEPQLRVSVRPQNILNWVSEWEAEDWEERDFIQKEKEEEEALLPIILAQEARKQNKMEKVSREGVKTDVRKRKRSKSPTWKFPMKKVGTGRGRGRPPLAGRLATKMTPLPGPGRILQPSREPVLYPFTSPRSQRRASTGLAHIATPLLDSDDSETEEESDDTDAALKGQSDNDQTDQDSESPDPLVNEIAGPGLKNQHPEAASSKRCRSLSFVDRSTVATASAYEAGQIWDNLTRKANQKASVHSSLPSMNNNTAKSEHSIEITHTPAKGPFIQKQITPPVLYSSDAMATGMEKENKPKDKRPVPRQVQRYNITPPIHIAADPREFETLTQVTRTSMAPQNTISSITNRSNRSHEQPYKYKSAFDNPVTNKTYKSPFDDPQEFVARQSTINHTNRNTFVASGHVFSKSRAHPFSSVINNQYEEEKGINVGTNDGDNDDNDEEEYNVERILDARTRVVGGRKVRFYLIQWEGDWENTWEPQENVSHTAISEFEATKRVTARQNAARSNSNYDEQIQVHSRKESSWATRVASSPGEQTEALRHVTSTAHSNKAHELQNSNSVSNQARYAPLKYDERSNKAPQIWQPSSGGDEDIANNPKCPPCALYERGSCYGGLPCERCKERGFSAEICAKQTLKDDNTMSRPNGTKPQIRGNLGMTKAANPITKGTSRNEEMKVVVVISSDEEEEDEDDDEEDGDSLSEKGQSHVIEMQFAKQRHSNKVNIRR